MNDTTVPPLDPNDYLWNDMTPDNYVWLMCMCVANTEDEDEAVAEALILVKAGIAYGDPACSPDALLAAVARKLGALIRGEHWDPEGYNNPDAPDDPDCPECNNMRFGVWTGRK